MLIVSFYTIAVLLALFLRLLVRQVCVCFLFARILFLELFPSGVVCSLRLNIICMLTCVSGTFLNLTGQIDSSACRSCAAGTPRNYARIFMRFYVHVIPMLLLLLLFSHFRLSALSRRWVSLRCVLVSARLWIGRFQLS